VVPIVAVWWIGFS